MYFIVKGIVFEELNHRITWWQVFFVVLLADRNIGLFLKDLSNYLDLGWQAFPQNKGEGILLP